MIVNFKSLEKNSRVWVFQSLDFIDDRPVSYTHLRAHETPEHIVFRLND